MCMSGNAGLVGSSCFYLLLSSFAWVALHFRRKMTEYSVGEYWKGPKLNIIVKEASRERNLCLKIIHTVEVDATYFSFFFKRCFSSFDICRVHPDLCICLVFFTGKLQRQSWSQTSPPGRFLPSAFTCEKPHLCSMLAAIPPLFRLQNVLRTHLTSNSALCCLAILACIKYKTRSVPFSPCCC